MFRIKPVFWESLECGIEIVASRYLDLVVVVVDCKLELFNFENWGWSSNLDAGPSLAVGPVVVPCGLNSLLVLVLGGLKVPHIYGIRSRASSISKHPDSLRRSSAHELFTPNDTGAEFISTQSLLILYPQRFSNRRGKQTSPTQPTNHPASHHGGEQSLPRRRRVRPQSNSPFPKSHTNRT